jgi:type IV secretory pathway VirB2 component (pilin)
LFYAGAEKALEGRGKTMISVLVIVIGALLWWLAPGKFESAGVIIFAVGVFYLVGDYKGWRPTPTPKA